MSNIRLSITDDREALLSTMKRSTAKNNRRDMRRLYLSQSEYDNLLKVAQERGYFEPDATPEQAAIEAMIADISALATSESES